MNNDVAGKLNSRINVQQNNGCANTIQKQAAQKTSSPIDSDKMDESMRYLGTLGEAQVNLDGIVVSKSVKESVDEFLADPEQVQAYIEMCDSIVERGHCLREAIDKTDCVFDILKEENIYN